MVDILFEKGCKFTHTAEVIVKISTEDIKQTPITIMTNEEIMYSIHDIIYFNAESTTVTFKYNTLIAYKDKPNLLQGTSLRTGLSHLPS